jgi:tetraacyldisaccharide 4'-kinase
MHTKLRELDMTKSDKTVHVGVSAAYNGLPVMRWIGPLFLPFSWLYEIGLEVYLLPYKLGIRKRRRIDCRVVSVGNLTFGGTGKSPAVRAICEILVKQGIKPAVLSRGHGGRLCTTGAIASDGKRRLLEAMDCGDEPAVLADALPGVPIGIGKNRAKVGRMLIDQFQPDVMVLDDGMQYWQLHRDVEIVLCRADRPFGIGRVLPAGDLREPKRGIRRADVVLITGVGIVGEEQSERLRELIQKKAPRAEIFFARKAPQAIIDCASGERLPVSVLKGLSVVAVSGIGNPTSFETMLVEYGAKIQESLQFGDHCSYSSGEAELVKEVFKNTGAQSILTTAKDAVKLRLPNMYVLDIELIIENMDRLVELVTQKTRAAS